MLGIFCLTLKLLLCIPHHLIVSSSSFSFKKSGTIIIQILFICHIITLPWILCLIFIRLEIVLSRRFIIIFRMNIPLIILLNGIISIERVVLINDFNFFVFWNCLKSIGADWFWVNFLFHVNCNVFLWKCFLLFLLIWCHF